MPEASDAKGILRQNLIYAGRGPELVRAFARLSAESGGISLKLHWEESICKFLY